MFVKSGPVDSSASTARLRYLGHRLVMYGFVGVSLANSQDVSVSPVPICKQLAVSFCQSIFMGKFHMVSLCAFL